MSVTPANTCFASVIDIGEVCDIYCPVSMTPVMHVLAGVNETGNACIAGVVDTVDAPVGPLAVRECL